MAERTSEQILDQAVYAVAQVARHYGPGFSDNGLRQLRMALATLNPWVTDSYYRVDCYDDDPYIDFHQRIITPDDWDGLDFEETVRASDAQDW